MSDPGSAQAWNGYSYVSNSPMSFVDPSGLVRAGPGCNIGPVMCLDGGGASGGGFGMEPVVSTYRYRHVDVFASTRIVPGGIYGGGNGPGALDGWWDFMDPFVDVHYHYVIREGIGQLTSRVPVGTPNIPGKDMDRGTGRLHHRAIERRVSHRFGMDEAGAHRYVIRGLICRSSTEGCDDDLAQAVFEHVNRNDVPPFADDRGSGEKVLIGDNRIYHTEIPEERRTVNRAKEGEHILKGTVEHRVYQGPENGDIYYEVLGRGKPGERRPGLSNLGGRVMFLPGVYRAVRIYGR